MYSDLFFDTTSVDVDEVNTRLAMWLREACQRLMTRSSQKVHRTTVERDRYGAHDRLVMAYFSEQPQYDEATFRERFRMSRRLFTKIVREVTDASQFFQERYDCRGQRSISALMKCTSAIRQLAYGCVPDLLTNICKWVRQHLVILSESFHGFLGMLGSIDCTDWPWANCLVAFKAQFSRGDHGPDPFILLEAIASNDFWIWHAFFGVSGMNNDVNVLRQSPIFNDLKSGRAPGTNDHKRILYKIKHEAARKDVDRAGVLKQKWKIIKYPARGMTRSLLSDIMYTCLILHNMIIHDNGNAISPEFFPKEQHRDDDPLDASIKAMKEEYDAKFEELKQLILGTAPSQSIHVDHVPQITKVAAKTAPYVPPIRQGYDDLGLELHNSNAESSTTIGKTLRPKYWDVER
ncbi:ALP1-like protein [Tanacetum coccineum]